ncbi:MAG: Hsp70 family protein, partial [Gammaproteobacteria bacterium]
LVDVRNTADGMIHSVEKSLKELGDKVEADERSKVDEAIANLKEAIKTEDKADIEAKTQALTEAAGKIAEKAYAQQAEAANADEASASSGKASAESGEEVVDAEFEEVKEDK